MNSRALMSCFFVFVACNSFAQFGTPFVPSSREMLMETSSSLTLSPGPNVDGVAYLQQGVWDEKVTNTFHETPWIDSASLRMQWKEIEKADQQFDWTSFDKVLTEVKRYNKEHPQAHRTMQIRVIAGRSLPRMDGRKRRSLL